MDPGAAPPEITDAVQHGRLDEVEAWLDGGGDPNATCRVVGSVSGGSLLLSAAHRSNTSMMHLLLSRGADINHTDNWGRTALYILLNHFGERGGSLSALMLLLSNGADVNLTWSQSYSGSLAGKSPLMHACSRGPDVVRLLLRAGADAEHRARGTSLMAEECARRDGRLINTESANLLRDVRLAGGWVRYSLQPHYDLLVLRALGHRGRATFDSWTPEVLVRLFGAPGALRRNNAVRGRTDLPDPVFWRVLEFAFGTVYDYPWVRHRVRARAAAAAAGG